MARLRVSRSTVGGGATQPNILILCGDDHRADAIGGLGHPLLRTPNWDRLLREGTTFRHAYTGIPIGSPARAELLTGSGPETHGVQETGEPLRSGCPLLARHFAEAGYATFFTGKWDADGTPEGWGFQESRRVVTEVSDHHLTFEENNRTVTGFSSELFAEAAADYLASHRDPRTPWLAFVAFAAPHDPRTPPVGWRVDPRRVPLPPNFMPEHPFDNGAMTARDELLAPWPREEGEIREHLADYYGMLLHLDAQVGRVLAALDAAHAANRTIVVYTSDHGLAIGGHGLMGKRNLYEHSVRVPLIWRGPTISERDESSALCRGADLFPSLCELAGVAIPEGVTGRSLATVLRGDAALHRSEITCTVGKTQRMVTNGRYKLIQYPKTNSEQLFDLESDPEELANLLDTWRFRPAPGYTPPSDGEQYHGIAARLRSRLPEISA